MVSTNLIKIFTVIWLLVIVVLHCLPASGFPEINWFHHFQIDKIIHFMMFFPLAIGFKKGFKLPTAFIVLLSILLAIALELIQGTFIAGRVADIGDFLADFAGVIVGLVLLRRK